MDTGELVRLRGMPKTEWHAPTRTWLTLDGTLGRVRRRYGTAYPGLAVDLLRRHRGTGKPLRPRTVHITPDQALRAEPLGADEERLVAESAPLLAAAERERDRKEVGGALWRQSWESTGEAMSDARRKLVDEVEQALTDGAKGKPEALQAIARWFDANRPLLTLAAQHLLARAAEKPTSQPTLTDSELQSPLGDEVYLNGEGDLEPAEVLDALGEPHAWDDESLAAVREIENWDFDAHFDGRHGRKDEFAALYDPFYATGTSKPEDQYTEAVGDVAYLICPRRLLLARAGRPLLSLLASVAPHLEHARRAAGWDYREPMMAAVIDAIQVEYAERQESVIRRWLLAKERACLAHGVSGVLFFALLFRGIGADAHRQAFRRVAKFVGDRADYNPPGQPVLPGFKADTAESVLLEALRQMTPDLARRLDTDLGEDFEELAGDES